MRFLMLLVLSALAACAAPEVGDAPEQVGRIVVDGEPLVDAQGIRSNAVQEKLTADPALCRANGGEVRPVCMRGNDYCVVPFSDGGKTCTDGAQCLSGRCFGDGKDDFDAEATGTCAANNDPCGCFQLVEDGKATPTLCVD